MAGEDDNDGDVWAGSRLHGVDITSTMCLSLTADAAVIETFRSRSYTPVIVRLLNLPPHIRVTAAGLFLWAEVPPNTNKTEVLESLLQQNKTLFTEGIEIYDGHQSTNRVITIKIARIVEDARGIQEQVGCFQNNSTIGGCPFCDIKGVSLANSVYHFGSGIQFTSRNTEDHALRLEFSDHFRDATNTEVTNVHKLSCSLRKTSDVLPEARRCENDVKSNEKKYFWKFESPYNKVNVSFIVFTLFRSMTYIYASI